MIDYITQVTLLLTLHNQELSRQSPDPFQGFRSGNETNTPVHVLINVHTAIQLAILCHYYTSNRIEYTSKELSIQQSSV